MAINFNLLEEPFLPVVTKEGKAVEVNLTQALSLDNNYVRIRDTNPLITFGLYRFISILLQDIFRLQIRDTNLLGEMIDSINNKDESSQRIIKTYLNQNRHRFNLFDAKYPFLQDPTLATTDKQRRDITSLYPHIPSGTNVLQFSTKNKSDSGYSPAEVAKQLITMPHFTTVDGNGYSYSINKTPPWYALVIGSTMLETAALNCCVEHFEDTQELGVPYWRSNNTIKPGPKLKFDLLEGLWMPTRRVLLIPSNAGVCAATNRQCPVLIKEMFFQPGVKSGIDWLSDPNVVYSRAGKEIKTFKPSEKYRSWREFGALTFRRDGNISDKSNIRPKVFDQLDRLLSEDYLPKDWVGSIQAFGLQTDQAKKLNWYTISLDINNTLVYRSDLAKYATDAIAYTEYIERILFQVLKIIFEKATKAKEYSLHSREISKFWDALSADYVRLTKNVAALPKDNHQDEALKYLHEFKDIVNTQGRKIIINSSRSAGSNYKELAVMLKALHNYNSLLRKYKEKTN